MSVMRSKVPASDSDTSTSATITSTGGGQTFQTSDASVTGPLPVLGFRALWDMSHNFYLDALVQFFYISFDNFDGSITDGKVAVTWMPWQNVGFGVGWNSFYTRVDVSKDGFDGKLKFGYGGAMAFVTVAFLIPGAVSITRRSTVFGSETPTGVSLSWNSISTRKFGIR